MKFTFKMTAEEYYSGWKYKNKKASLNQYYLPKSIILALIVIVFSVIVKVYYGCVFAVILLLMGIFMDNFQKKSVVRNFLSSPILCTEQTIRTFDEGIELINGYEKIFAPWKSVFAVQETEKYIKILPTFSKGIAVISKERYSSSELDSLMRIISSHVKVEEGKG